MVGELNSEGGDGREGVEMVQMGSINLSLEEMGDFDRFLFTMFRFKISRQ